MILQFNLLSGFFRAHSFTTAHASGGIEFSLSHWTNNSMTGVVEVDKVEGDDKGTEDGGTDSDVMLITGDNSR